MIGSNQTVRSQIFGKFWKKAEVLDNMWRKIPQWNKNMAIKIVFNENVKGNARALDKILFFLFLYLYELNIKKSRPCSKYLWHYL